MKNKRNDNPTEQEQLSLILQILSAKNNEAVGDNEGFSEFSCSAQSTIIDFFRTFTDKQMETAAMNIINQCNALQAMVYKHLLDTVSQKMVQLEEDYRKKQYALSEAAQKKVKATFTVQEAIAISAKSRNTIYTHLKNGILIGKQDDLGRWTIRREDLENYLNRNDF